MRKILSSVLLLILSWTAAMSNAVEEPAWSLLETVGDVELRQYEALVQARTPMPEGARSGSGFRTLAGYIFGGNADDKEIAMTAPVEQTLATGGNYMAFTIPREHSLDDLPRPDDDRVSLHPVPAKKMAVISFSGWARDAVVEENVRILLATLDEHGIETLGQPVLAQYNPPWTPPWKRRNEVMVEIE